MSTPQKSAKRNGGKNISTFCRIRPATGNTSLRYHVATSYDKTATAETIQFQRSTEYDSLSASAKERRTQNYTFNEIFKEDHPQDKLFDKVGKPVIENVLKGYNGTIFAYGQTATGKTYTVMGEELEYDDAEERGLIPRALEWIFADLEASDHKFEVKISFLEIYKESMFDLLDTEMYTFNKQTFTKKHKITCKMDDEKVRLEGLTYRTVENGDDAMEIFLGGNQTREVAQTYANDRSSRSHVVFTIYIEREDDTGKLESKLHFVDLAGSERVSKNHLGSRELISEAKDINRSLLFLHKVIKSIAFNQKPETFRNTMITKILRDSLIGNSMTSLVATISIEIENIDETLSTCEFAQSVSKIKTRPIKNKKEDLDLIIANLKADNKKLNEKIHELEHPTEPTDDEKANLKQQVLEFYNDEDPDVSLKVEEENGRVQFCFRELKALAKSDGRDSPKPPEREKTLTEEDIRTLNGKIDAFLGQNDPNAALEYGDVSIQAQYCFRRLKYIVKEFDDRPRKKKGCC